LFFSISLSLLWYLWISFSQPAADISATAPQMRLQNNCITPWHPELHLQQLRSFPYLSWKT
jgi:hypothetical protein